MLQLAVSGLVDGPPFDAEFVRSLPTPAVVDTTHFDLPTMRREIETVGYSIGRRLVDPNALEQIRRFWLARYAATRPTPRVTWSPYLGQENTIGFSDDAFQKLFRSCDFLWNPPFEPLSREICLQLSRLRNVIADLPLFAGEVFAEDRYGVFVTTSYYPPDGGWMKVHTDGVAPGASLVHHIVPLTFKGIDYAGGGMVIVDRAGRRVDVDGQLNPGDVVFYDGALPHGVDVIVPHPGRELGRLQMFAIPTRFTNVEEKQHVLEKIGYRTLTRAKLSLLKRKLRGLVGLEAGR